MREHVPAAPGGACCSVSQAGCLLDFCGPDPVQP